MSCTQHGLYPGARGTKMPGEPGPAEWVLMCTPKDGTIATQNVIIVLSRKPFHIPGYTSHWKKHQWWWNSPLPSLCQHSLGCLRTGGFEDLSEKLNYGMVDSSDYCFPTCFWDLEFLQRASQSIKELPQSSEFIWRICEPMLVSSMDIAPNKVTLCWSCWADHAIPMCNIRLQNGPHSDLCSGCWLRGMRERSKHMLEASHWFLTHDWCYRESRVCTKDARPLWILQKERNASQTGEEWNVKPEGHL